MIKVKTVKVMANYCLLIEFSDGTNGIADLSECIKHKPFLALQSEAMFSEAMVEAGAVEWPSAEIGIATEALYAMAHGLLHPTTLEQSKINELEVSSRQSEK